MSMTVKRYDCQRPIIQEPETIPEALMVQSRLINIYDTPEHKG